MINYKPPIELISNEVNIDKINASVIWLHGLGANGHDFEPVVKQLLPQNLSHVRFILPHAPEMAVTRNSGYIMPAWYDLYGVTGSSKEDETGIVATQHYINSLIQLEINKGITANRIVIAGFSQGGAIALYTALRYPKKLAGVLALSTYLPLKTKLAAEATSANLTVPIFMAHGTADEIISLALNKVSLDVLQSNHYSVSWHEYNMSHSVCAAEINDIRDFLQKVLHQDLVE